eukprot:COSAG02_NODE_549_length_20461_cov_11.385866_11_plen_68_part_00
MPACEAAIRTGRCGSPGDAAIQEPVQTLRESESYPVLAFQEATSAGAQATQAGEGIDRHLERLISRR